MLTPSRTCVRLSSMLALASLASGELAAQSVRDLKNSPFLGIGYVVSLPNTFVGGAFMVTTPALLGGAGVYADFKTSTRTRADDPYLLPGITPTQAELSFGDQFFADEGTYYSANLALVVSLTPEFALYGGAGYAHVSRYNEYFDDGQTRGEFGFYWVRDPIDSGSRINILGGGLFRLHRHMLFQAGLDSQPLGATIGLMLTLPVG